MIGRVIAAHWKILVAGVLIVSAIAYGQIQAARLARLERKLAEAQQALQTAAAERRGYQAVTPTTPAKVEAALSPEAKAELAEIRRTVKSTSVALHALTTATIENTAPGKLIPATPTTPPICEDAFNRFRVNTADCSFSIRQKFKFEATMLRGVDGKTRLFKHRLIEEDPVTGLPIPGEPPQLVSDVQIADEAAPPEKVFGLKILGGVDERLAPGLGLQALEKWRLSLRALGFYQPKTEELRGQFGIGWRPKIAFLDSAVSIGAGIGLSTKKSGLIYGAHLTVPLARVTK